MAEPQTAPYGTWRSPITADLIVAGTIGLDTIVLAGAETYWLEQRPAEEGRYVLVKRLADGRATDLTPPPYNVRTRVHEYGGASVVVAGDDVVFSNFADGRLYRIRPGRAPHPITPAGAMRYADGLFDAARGRLILVREDHSNPEREAVTTLVSVALDAAGDGDGSDRTDSANGAEPANAGGATRADGAEGAGDAGTVLVEGSDFYASPRLSPDGAQLVWLSWNHPNMPFDGTELWVADVGSDGSLGPARRVAGGVEESIFQPEWSPDGVLHFVSDRTGWWNLYRWRNGQAEPLCPMEAEFGLPQWVFGMATYGFEAPGHIICAYDERGRWSLARLDTATGRLTPIPTPYTEITGVRVAPGSGYAAFLGGAPSLPRQVVRLDLATLETTALRRSSEIAVDPGHLSTPEAIEFPTEAGLTAHGFFYAPHNKDYTAPPHERPPLLVVSHGGPTSATSTELDLEIQYWASRGIAVLDVNYGGSTGYGRAYRERLNGAWGIVDVDDCVNGARYLVAQGRADGIRLAIRGGSAGGYTTLAALTFRDVFKAGASYYGVSDLEALAQETHKFESRYLDRLVGPYPARRDVYRERSPIHYTARLAAPIIFFQGLDDKVVPPNQAVMMVEALRAKGLPVAYVAFAGEGHGFRRADTIKRALEAELYFYGRVFGFTPADTLEPVAIDNL